MGQQEMNMIMGSVRGGFAIGICMKSIKKTR